METEVRSHDEHKHNLPIFDNVLNRHKHRLPPIKHGYRTSLISAHKTQSGWLYLPAVLDLYFHMIVGWAMATTVPVELVCSTLQIAITQHNPPPGLIVHSNRGSQNYKGA